MSFDRQQGFHADARAARAAGSDKPWRERVPWLFVIMVVAPTLLAAIYYLIIASPIYVSDARFVVRARGQGQPTALGSLLQTVGVPGVASETDSFEVHEYMDSRDGLTDLIKDHDLRDRLARPGADFLARFPRPFESQSVESLYKNYKRFVTVGYDSQTGISTLRVKAFRAEDARDIANALLDGGEVLVNRLNVRAMTDAVSQTERQVEDADARGIAAQKRLTDFRNQERLIDPDKSSVADIDLLSKLELQISNLRAERSGLAASAPDSPQIPVLDKQIAAYSAQLDSERSRSAGEANSLAPKIGEYEQLVLQRDIAVKSLEAAESSLEAARLDARRQQLFLERVVSPDLPDRAEEPRRFLAIFKVLVSCLVAFGTVSLFAAGLREHRHR
jgi:capsular polysaccharide transport system permease protein